MTTFEEKYDCQIHYQYMFDGKTKKHFPIISNLHLDDDELDLSEFSSYPVITFHNCQLSTVTIRTSRLRDLNFQDSQVSGLNLDIRDFTGTLGFANSTLSLVSFFTQNSPQILAIIESSVVGLKNPGIAGLELHTLAVINCSLDYLDLNPLLSIISLSQLILSEIHSPVPINFTIPKDLISLKLKNITLHQLPSFNSELHLESLHLEELDIVSYHHELANLSELIHLRSLYINKTTIKFLPDFNLPSLEELSVSRDMELDDKLMARLKLTGLRIDQV